MSNLVVSLLNAAAAIAGVCIVHSFFIMLRSLKEEATRCRKLLSEILMEVGEVEYNASLVVNDKSDENSAFKLSDAIKQAVIKTLNDERRPGGLLDHCR